MNNAYSTALEVLSQIRNAGFFAYFAGGSVRDRLLGRKAKDYDIATAARPEQVETLFQKTVAVGKAFGVIVVIRDGIAIEVATFRSDGSYPDGRRPKSIEFCDAREDAIRRDFTINGMFYDPIEEKLFDYVGGKKDLEKRIIRAIGNPERRFAEDHLRMLRAVRFAYTLGFEIEPITYAAIRKHAPDLGKISAERIESEFSRILTESIQPGKAVRELVDLGLMKYMVPEIFPMIGQKQPPQFHPEGDVFEHTILMLNLMNKGNNSIVKSPLSDLSLVDSSASQSSLRELAYAVLLHDIGKPHTAFLGKDRLRFHGHEKKSAEIGEEVLRRLKLPIREIKRIVIAIDGHMRFKDVPKMNQSTLRKLIASDTFALELELHRIDCEGSHGLLDNYHFLRKKIGEIKEMPILPARWIRGNDLIELGMKSGPDLGALLKKAYDAQLNERFADRAELLAWICTHF